MVRARASDVPKNENTLKEKFGTLKRRDEVLVVITVINNVHAGSRCVRDDGHVGLHVFGAYHALGPESLQALVIPVVGVAAEVDQAQGS